jgi:hypothetical protein
MIRFPVLALALLALTSASSARGQETDEVKRLKREIELLERELKVARSENDLLKAKITEFEKGQSKKGSEPPKADPFDVGTKWKGTATFDNKTKMTAVVTVVERGEKTVKLSISFENKAVWTFNCPTEGRLLSIKGAEREKASEANEGNKGLRPVGGTSGKGEVDGAKLTLNYTVPAGNNQASLVVRVVAEREK